MNLGGGLDDLVVCQATGHTHALHVRLTAREDLPRHDAVFVGDHVADVDTVAQEVPPCGRWAVGVDHARPRDVSPIAPATFHGSIATWFVRCTRGEAYASVIELALYCRSMKFRRVVGVHAFDVYIVGPAPREILLDSFDGVALAMQ